MKKRIVKLGEVGVDSGQLIMCDPSYIGSQWLTPHQSNLDHAHEIYRHVEDGKLWQFTYGTPSNIERVNAFPGNYADIIPEYSLCPSQLIDKGLFIVTNFDSRPHILNGEFSYRGICKTTKNENQGGQLNFGLGHAGVAVAFNTGYGDGRYPVYAEIVETQQLGTRIKKVWVEFF